MYGKFQTRKGLLCVSGESHSLNTNYLASLIYTYPNQTIQVLNKHKDYIHLRAVYPLQKKVTNKQK